jgi:putative flippase GtrA
MFAIHYIPAAVLASQVSTLNNFVLTELWVFRDRDTPGHVIWRYLTFNLLNMATLLVRVPVLYVLTDLAGVYYLISNLVAIGITFGIRYLVADNWIWAGRDRRDQKPIDGWYQYDVHGIVRIISTVHLPELAAFNVAHRVDPDIVIRRRASASPTGVTKAARSATASTSGRCRRRSTCASARRSSSTPTGC